MGTAHADRASNGLGRGDRPAASTVESFVTTDDGCRLWTARVAAEAPARPRAAAPPAPDGFVLCHGGPGFWDTLGPIADLLADRAPVIRWDQRGSGRSMHREPYTVAGFVADLDTVRAAYGLDRVTVVGHSWGAALAVHYALTHPERIHSLIYIAGVGLGWDWRPQHIANAEAALSPHAAKLAALDALERPTAGQQREADLLRMTADFPDPVTGRIHARRLLEPYFPADPRLGPTLRTEIKALPESDLVARCRALPATLPTLIVDGARDLRPRWSVDSLAAALPSVTRVTLESAGHLPWLDEPERFAAALADFLG